MKKSALKARGGVNSTVQQRGPAGARAPQQRDDEGGAGEKMAKPHPRGRSVPGGAENDAPLPPPHGPGNYRRGGGFQPMRGNAAANANHRQQQQPGGGQPQGQQYRPPHANGVPNGVPNGPHNGAGRRPPGGPGAEEAAAALGQKNHRLAKELSDLRVRHREETKVVSRLTMENMNLASRCREAIAQVAALKKEVLVYQKRQSEWGTLQREVMQLRKQIDKSAAAGGGGGGSGGEKKRSSLGSPDAGAGGSDAATPRASPSTELDRIMSQQFRKPEAAPADEGRKDLAGGLAKLREEKKELTAGGGLAKKIQNQKSSPSSGSGGGIVASAINSINKQQKGGERAATSANNLASSNTKIPVSVAPSSAKAAADQTDDEFDADIDMVDFFAKSQSPLGSPRGDSPPGAKGASSHLGSRAHHARKPKSTDDRMPGDVVPASPGSISPGADGTAAAKAATSPGDNLLSSLDAFEASFASAFPETSFSITSEAPLSSAKLDMSFDAPDFDPFFSKSSGAAGGKKGGGASGRGGAKSHRDLFPESAMGFRASPKTAEVTFDAAPPAGFAPMDEPLAQPQTKKGGLGGAESGGKRGKGGRAQLSPQSMSAEIEQLDAIAGLASAADGPTPKNATTDASAKSGSGRSLRKVKQPVSYKEPSTSSKLRRGDVLFPKVDAAEKTKKEGEAAKAGGGATSPTTDLDRIMREKMKPSESDK
ncbi:hypothetical protein ACHAXT_012845 [Thalassiosira profunda]